MCARLLIFLLLVCTIFFIVMRLYSPFVWFAFFRLLFFSIYSRASTLAHSFHVIVCHFIYPLRTHQCMLGPMNVFSFSISIQAASSCLYVYMSTKPINKNK